MKRILIVTQHADNFSKLAMGLSAEKANDIIWVNSVAAARSAAFSLLDLIIIDENLEGRSGLSIAKDMIRVNALAQLALVSELSPEEFHEAAEGLGVLAKLPPHPDEKDAERLLNALMALS
ncbi:MAG: response regulator transcription factor [Deltaproteobacteria bacterium]|nr:response regulator transcription factor [Deltaproteobacteria bacterium]